MKSSSRKKPADWVPPSDDPPAAAAAEEEEEEEESADREENQEAEEGGEEEEPEQDEQEDAPKLEEGYYEIEAIRKKRVRKGQLQYLIKWRGWPESANTWEPIDNLQSCSDVIDAFEERLQKSSRKRKRKYGIPQTLAKSKQGSHPEETNTENGDDKEAVDGNKTAEDAVEANGSPSGEQKKEDAAPDAAASADGYISIQLDGGLREEDGSMEDGSSKVECTQPLQGAKKRKSGCVRRFKQEDAPQANQDGKGEKLGSDDVDSTEDENGERVKLDGSLNPPYITKILKPVQYCASVTDNVQQVSITFKALRSDGQEVLVDDKDLKVNNPLLLISYYEQHLRYSPQT